MSNNDANDSSIKKKWYDFNEYKIHVTPRASVITLFVIGSTFFLLGILFLFLSQNNEEFSIRYDEICQDKPKCLVTLNITQNISGKIAFLYKLIGFYQNHRRIVDSISYTQLRGVYESYSNLQSCSPKISKNSSKLNEDIYVPCGLLPFSYFNDSFCLPQNSSFEKFTDQNIALKSDLNYFKPFNSKYDKSINWLSSYTDFPGLNMNEHFIVWIRTAAMPDFLKLYMKCEDCTIRKGLYQIEIHMNYPKSMFPGERWLVLSKTSSIGSQSHFIVIAYFSMGSLGIIFAIAFLIHMLFCPKKFGDLSLIWPESNVEHNHESIATNFLPNAYSSSEEESMTSNPSKESNELKDLNN